MKLHLGCGEKYIEGFIHVDLLEFDHIDYKTSIDKLYFAADDSIDLIYASHLLEHVGRHEFKNVLAEWYRALKPSGVLRIAVPDFEALISHYCINHNLQEVCAFPCRGLRFPKPLHGFPMRLHGFSCKYL